MGGKGWDGMVGVWLADSTVIRRWGPRASQAKHAMMEGEGFSY